MQKTTSTQKLTLILRGSSPLMQEVRKTLLQLQEQGQKLEVLSSFTGDVTYDPEAVALFVYDERTMRTSERTTPIRRKSNYLCTGRMSYIYDRLEMDPPTWAPNASVFIALWPERDTAQLAQAVQDGVRNACKYLRILAADKQPSKRKLRALEHRQRMQARRSLPVMNRPSPDYILALEERDGIIGS